MHAHTRTYTYTGTHACTHTNERTHTRARTHGRTHARTHAHTHTHPRGTIKHIVFISYNIILPLQAWKTKKAEADIPDDEYTYLETNKEFTAVDTDKVQYLFGG